MCHIILAIPVLALVLFFFFPFRVALTIYLPVAAASGFVYFKVMKAMGSKVQTGLQQMIGEEAVVIEDINPEGRVEIMDEIWAATGNGEKFSRGKKVRIVGAHNLVLIVEDPEEKWNSATG
jgi:inner membrane protein